MPCSHFAGVFAVLQLRVVERVGNSAPVLRRCRLFHARTPRSKTVKVGKVPENAAEVLQRATTGQVCLRCRQTALDRWTVHSIIS